jgi:hypothetical protein
VCADRSVTRVEEVAENKPSTLIFLIPPLKAGSYKLAVIAACRGTEELEMGILDDVLRVGLPDPLLEQPPRDFGADAIRLLDAYRTREEGGEEQPPQSAPI